MTDSGATEFSHLLGREQLRRGLQRLSLVADAGQRAALARRFGLLALDRLQAEVALTPDSGGELLRVEGHLSAAASQACVVTLEPVAALVEEDFSLQFSFLLEVASTERELLVDPEAEDPPEPLGPEGLDLGEALAQQLAVALEPYPRAPGAALDPALAAPEPAGDPEGPFAELIAFKPRR